jgi:hypothetical protein
VAKLTEAEYQATMRDMARVAEPDLLPSLDVGTYWREEVDEGDLEGHDFSERPVVGVFQSGTTPFTHLVVASATPNVFLVIVIDRELARVSGHRLLNLNEKYGVDSLPSTVL